MEGEGRDSRERLTPDRVGDPQGGAREDGDESGVLARVEPGVAEGVVGLAEEAEGEACGAAKEQAKSGEATGEGWP